MTSTPAPAAEMFRLPAAGTSWKAYGLCSQVDPELFFPEVGIAAKEAKQTCMACEVRTVCLTYALDNDERFGIWGGLSERERRNLRKTGIDPAVALALEPERAPQAFGRRPQGGGQPLAPCGTETAHRRHSRRGEVIDDACATAHAAFLDSTRLVRRAARRRSRERIRASQGARGLAPCGTAAAYTRHKRRGETPCQPCREAHNEARRVYDRQARANAA